MKLAVKKKNIGVSARRLSGIIFAPMLGILIQALFLVLSPILKLRVKHLPKKSVLYVGQAYYSAWYLSRALRQLGWVADVLNVDQNPDGGMHYHGQDYIFDNNKSFSLIKQLSFYVLSVIKYDVFHFSNSHCMHFGTKLQSFFSRCLGEGSEIEFLRKSGKKIIYSNHGCLDGVSQTSFSKWGPESVCDICIWKNHPEVCSDTRNLTWGKFRNSMTDFQCLLGGNRADYNIDPRIHEVPEFYCLDPDVWKPTLDIPSKYLLETDGSSIKLYHAVGNRGIRTNSEGVNVKSSHIYLPLIDKLKNEGLNLEVLSPDNVPNLMVRYIQSQADIFLEMLTYGWFGANAREAMMLGKPVICYIRPEWLESLRLEIPEYADELPIISATPNTVEEVLRDLIRDNDKRDEVGRRGREFALKWHSSDAGGQFFDSIYWRLLAGESLELPTKLRY